jgi:RNA polymerase sigma factor (sigma-70 family)
MGGNDPRTVGQLLRGAAPPSGDRDLLGRLTSGPDDGAFAELVRRHGPLVLGVCRRVLGHEQDAEDAFQATFLVLVRKAGSVRNGRCLGAWLYGVARHVAVRLRDKDRRRQRHERAAARRAAGPAESDPGEWRAVLDEELQRLPDRYRSPVVACHLQGRTQEETAREMGWSLSTLRRRLDRGRELLRARLTGRGVTLPAGVLTLAGFTATVSPALADATRRAAAAFTQGERATVPAVLAQGVLAMMARAKLKLVAGAVFALGGLVAVWQAAPGFPAGPDGNVSAQVPKEPKDPPKIDFPEAAKKESDPTVNPADERIKPGERLHIRVTNALPNDPIDGMYPVEQTGKVALGPAYGGRVSLAGLTLEQAEAVLRDHLRKYLKDPEVRVTRFDPATDNRVVALERKVEQLERKVEQLEQEVRTLRFQLDRFGSEGKKTSPEVEKKPFPDEERKIPEKKN